MKKIDIFRMGVVAMLTLASCSTEKLEGPDGGKNVKGVYMSLTAYDENSAPEARTVLGDIDEKNKKAEVNFTSSDKLFVYGSNGEDIKGTQFGTEDTGRKTNYKFSTDNWPEGYTPTYAVATTSKTSKNVCTDDGKITMLVNNQTQSFKWSNSYAVNVAGHVGKVEDGATVLKNVCGLIQFSVSNPDIVKIVVSANGGEPLGGWITVDYSNLDSEDPAGFYTSGADADMFKALTLTVQDPMDNGAKITDGKFPVKNKYFISLLPGEYSKGITITMFNAEGKVMTREINSSLTIKRGEIRKFTNPIDYDIKEFTDPEMPKTLTFTIEGKWPFEEECGSVDAKDEYTYKYEAVNGWTGDFKFSMGGVNGGTYSSSGGDVFVVGGEDAGIAYIKLPAIEGRVLKSVTLRHRNSNLRTFYVSANENGSDLVTETSVQNEDKTVELYSNDNVITKPNTSYYLRVLKSGTRCTKIEAVYVEPFPLDVPDEFPVVLDFSESWPFKPAKVANQSPAGEGCDGEEYSYKYSDNTYLYFGICKGQVNTYTASGALSFPRMSKPESEGGGYYDNEGFFKTAAIPGRYLKEIKVTTTVKSHTIYICTSNKKETSGSGLLKSFSTTQDKESSSGELTTTEENTSYYIFRNSSTTETYKKIELVYGTKTATE